MDITARQGAHRRRRAGRRGGPPGRRDARPGYRLEASAARSLELPAGRHSHQGGPRLDGGGPGGARAAARSSGGGVWLAVAVRAPDREWTKHAAVTRGSRPLRARCPGQATENGIQHSGRRVVAGAVTALGRGSVVAARAGRRHIRRGHGAPDGSTRSCRAGANRSTLCGRSCNSRRGGASMGERSCALVGVGSPCPGNAGRAG